VDSCPKVVPSFSGWIRVELSGSAGVLEYFSFGRSLFVTTLRLLFKLVGLPRSLSAFVRLIAMPVDITTERLLEALTNPTDVRLTIAATVRPTKVKIGNLGFLGGWL